MHKTAISLTFNHTEMDSHRCNPQMCTWVLFTYSLIRLCSPERHYISISALRAASAIYVCNNKSAKLLQSLRQRNQSAFSLPGCRATRHHFPIPPFNVHLFPLHFLLNSIVFLTKRYICFKNMSNLYHWCGVLAFFKKTKIKMLIDPNAQWMTFPPAKALLCAN